MLTNGQTEELHALYEQLTGQQVVLTVGRRCAWQAWAVAIASWIRHSGHRLTIREALQLVVARRRSQWRDKPHTCASVLKFTNLVDRTETCEEDLAAATAARRASRAGGDPARAAVLRATGRETQTAGEARAVGDFASPEQIQRMIAGMKEAAK